MGKVDPMVERMREWVDSNFKSATEAAGKLGMTYSNLSQYLGGKRHPGYEVLKRFREAGCNINWLLTGDTTPIDDADKLRKRISELERVIEVIQSAIPPKKEA